jgi:hypothetical protein
MCKYWVFLIRVQYEDLSSAFQAARHKYALASLEWYDYVDQRGAANESQAAVLVLDVVVWGSVDAWKVALGRG